MLRPRTRDALARTRSTGAHVVVVTGRMFRAVRPYLGQAQLDDLVVCYQGAVVADPATGEFLLHVPIPLAEAREAMDAVLISKSLPYFLEFAHPDVSKGSGLAFVAERLGFRAEETVACGDGENDRELLDWAGFGVAVANAHEDVLARADLVVPSVQEEGVAVLLESYLDSVA